MIMFALGALVGLVAGVIRWRSALEEERQHNEQLRRESGWSKETDRCYRNELLYWQTLATGDVVFLDTLGARAGILTMSDGTEPWATLEARKHAATLYERARRRLAELDAGAD